jgi:hypothetical protein
VTTVPAGVGEGPQGVGLRQQDGYVANDNRPLPYVVTGVGVDEELVDPAEARPASREQVSSFPGQDLR